MKTWEEALNSEEPGNSPEESRFNGISYEDRVKLENGIERALLDADSYCLSMKKLMFQVMQNPQLKPFCMSNHDGVSAIIDGMIGSGKIDEVAFYSTGLVALSEHYFKQFKDPTIMMGRGENKEASQARKAGRYLVTDKDVSDCTGVDDFLKRMARGDFGYREKDLYNQK